MYLDRDRARLSGRAADLLHHSKFRFIVTGASGWLGRVTLELLADALGSQFEHRVRCFGSSTRNIELDDGRSIEQNTLSHLAELRPAPSVLLHYAFHTRDKLASFSAASYIAANREIAQTVERQLTRLGVTRIFLLSSGAVYRPDRTLSDDLATNPYGALKLEDEQRFTRWAESQAGRSLVVARVFNLSGEYINKVSTYALTSLLLDALRQRPMRIRAPHRVIRSYVDSAELVSVGLAQCLANHCDVTDTWDTMGDKEVELQQLAAAIGVALGQPAVIDRPAPVADPDDRYVGEGHRYRQLCAQLNIEPLDLIAQIRRTAAYLHNVLGGEDVKDNTANC
jgi:UDP-glucuronate decarboxylase